MNIDWDKIWPGLLPVVAAVVTAMLTLRGKQGDNISNDQDKFRKDLLGRIDKLELENATLRAKVTELTVENLSLKRDLEDLEDPEGGAP